VSERELQPPHSKKKNTVASAEPNDTECGFYHMMSSCAAWQINEIRFKYWYLNKYINFV
jgi:hypothetical protein